MSLRRLWIFLAIALPVLAAMLASMSSVDLAYHLRAGDEIVRTGAIPRVDTWTFTAEGLPWFDQQWGSQVILATVFRVAGWTGLALLRAVLVAITFGAVLLICLRRGMVSRDATLLTLGAFAIAAPALAMRPQLLGMAFFAVLLVVVFDRRRRPALLWTIPLLVIVWANVHGSFFLAPVVLVLAWLEDLAERSERAHQTLLVAVVSVVTACVTPFGPAVWAYAVGLSINPEVTRRITEWQPTTIRDAAGVLLFASAAFVIVVMARGRRVVPWPTLAWFGTFATIGLYAQRGLAWWALAAAVAVAGMLPAREPRAEPATPSMLRRLNVIVVVALVLAIVVLLPVWRPPDPRTGVPAAVLTDAPPGVTAAVRDVARPGDHVFGPQPWGSWFEFATPEVKVALDSRIEFFPIDVWNDYELVVTGREGWQERLETWGVAVVVVEAHDTAFRDRLIADGWTETFRDADGSVLVNGARMSVGRRPEPGLLDLGA